jgi:hypothetical protein
MDAGVMFYIKIFDLFIFQQLYDFLLQSFCIGNPNKRKLICASFTYSRYYIGNFINLLPHPLGQAKWYKVLKMNLLDQCFLLLRGKKDFLVVIP